MDKTEALVQIGNFRMKVNFNGNSVNDLRVALLALPEFADRCNPSTDRLQIYDKDYQEYLDVFNTDLVTTHSKVNIILLSKKEIAVDVANDQFSKPTLPDSESLVSESLVIDTRATETSQVLPSIYKLPKFPVNLENHLQQLKPIDNFVRREIIQFIYDDILKFTLVPGRYYGIVASSLVQTYPYLKDNVGSGSDSWRNALKFKFKNMRKRAVGPIIDYNRQKYSHKNKKNEEEKKTVKRKLNIETEIIVDPEDDISIAEHVAWLQKEAKRIKQDVAGIAIRMDKTFVERCAYIDSHSLVDVMEKYPCLQDSTQLLKDFFLKTGKDADKMFLNFMDRKTNKITNLTKKESRVVKLTKEMEALEDECNEAEKKCKVVLLALRSIVAHFREDESFLITTKTNNIAEWPVLQFETSKFWSSANRCRLYVDKVAFHQPLDVTEGISCLFAAYWVFGIAYPSKLANTLACMEQMFDLHVTPARNPVIKLMKALQQEP